MTNMKTLMLAAVAALSLGVGTAMAQESADGAFLLQQPWAGSAAAKHQAVQAQPQAGSSDVDQTRAPAYPQQTLIGGDGNG